MKYLIIGLMIVAAVMLISYFAAAISKNRIVFAVFRLMLLLLEFMLIVTFIISIVIGSNFYILVPLILVFGLLIYES